MAILRRTVTTIIIIVIFLGFSKPFLIRRLAPMNFKTKPNCKSYTKYCYLLWIPIKGILV